MAVHRLLAAVDSTPNVADITNAASTTATDTEGVARDTLFTAYAIESTKNSSNSPTSSDETTQETTKFSQKEGLQLRALSSLVYPAKHGPVEPKAVLVVDASTMSPPPPLSVFADKDPESRRHKHRYNVHAHSKCGRSTSGSHTVNPLRDVAAVSPSPVVRTHTAHKTLSQVTHTLQGQYMLVASGRRASLVGWSVEPTAGNIDVNGAKPEQPVGSNNSGNRSMQLRVLSSVRLGPPPSSVGQDDGKRAYGAGAEPIGMTATQGPSSSRGHVKLLICGGIHSSRRYEERSDGRTGDDIPTTGRAIQTRLGGGHGWGLHVEILTMAVRAHNEVSLTMSIMFITE